LVTETVDAAGPSTREAVMQRRYSLDHLTMLPATPPEVVYIAAEAGYDSVGLRIMPLGIPGEPHCEVARDAKLMRQTRRALAETGLSVSDIELVRIRPEMDPQEYESGFAAGAELGASDVTASIWTTDAGYALDMFDAVCAIARRYRLRVNLEFVAIAAVKTLRAASRVLRAADASNVGLVLDMYHVHRGGTELSELDDLPAEWFHFCQLCDAPARIPDSREQLEDEVRGHRLYPGEGDIDIASIIARVPEMVYALEIPNTARLQALGPSEYALCCLQATKEYFDRRLAAGH
jgi:sugar phosphate isomerase/epimerase